MNKKAFTLIELLVVIAIIALLLGILMPALARTRSQAKSLFCMNNLRQMALAADAYTQCNDGHYPIARYTYKPNGVMYQYCWDFTRVKRNGIWNTEPGLLWSGQTIEKVHQCPVFKGLSNTIDDPYTGYNYNVSYIGHGQGETITPCYPGQVLNFQWKPGRYAALVTPVKQQSVRRPAKAALFGDGQWRNGANKFMRAPLPWAGDNDPTLRAAGTQGFRHNGRTNIAWCDGHVSSQKEYYTETLPREKEKLDQYNETARVKIGFISPDNSAYDLK